MKMLVSNVTHQSCKVTRYTLSNAQQAFLNFILTPSSPHVELKIMILEKPENFILESFTDLDQSYTTFTEDRLSHTIQFSGVDRDRLSQKIFTSSSFRQKIDIVKGIAFGYCKPFLEKAYCWFVTVSKVAYLITSKTVWLFHRRIFSSSIDDQDNCMRIRFMVHLKTVIFIMGQFRYIKILTAPSFRGLKQKKWQRGWEMNN